MKKLKICLLLLVSCFCLSFFAMQKNNIKQVATAGIPFEIELPDVTVNFYDEDKTNLLASGTFPAGGVEYTGTIPTKENTENPNLYYYTYVWVDENGKEVDLSKVYEDTDLYVSFVLTPVDYTIEYNLDGGYANNRTTYNIETNSFYLVNPEPQRGYRFVGWSGTDLDGIVASVYINVNEENLKNRSYTAHYEITTYTVTVLVDGHGTVSVETFTSIYKSQISYSGNTFTVGDQTVVATAEENNPSYSYSFAYWDTNDIILGYHTTLEKNITITAVFDERANVYPIYFDARNVKIYTSSGNEVAYGQSINYGTMLTAVFTPTDHYHMTSFTLNGAPFEGVENNSVTFALTGNTIIGYEEEIDKYKVTFVSSSTEFGNIYNNEDEIANELSVGYGTRIKIAEDVLSLDELSFFAIPTDSTKQYVYEFIKWETNGAVAVTEDIVITAVFSQSLQKYQVNFESENVIVKLNDVAIESGSEIEFGSKLEVYYESSEHYHKTTFKVNNIDIENGDEIVVFDEIAITYAEEIDTFSVTFDDGVNILNGGNPISSGDVLPYGTTLQAVYVLSKNYKLEYFKVNGKNIENGSEFVVNTNIAVTFKQVKDKIKIYKESAQNGSFTLSADAIEFGETVTISYSPIEYFKLQEAYYVLEESGQNVPIEGGKFIMPNEEVTVYVVFVREYYELKNEIFNITVAVKVDDFDSEPELIVEEDENNLIFAGNIFNSENFKVYKISIKVEEDEIQNLTSFAKVKMGTPSEIDGSKLQLILISNSENGSTYVPINFSASSASTIEFETNKLGIIALGEQQTKLGDAENIASGSQESKETSGLGLIIGIVAGVLVFVVIVVIIVIKRKKRRR